METTAILYVFAGFTALSVLGILLTRNVLYAAFLLVLVILAMAGLFVLAGAGFVAVSQIMIYVGGILILLVFGIMLTNRIAGQQVFTPVKGGITGTLLAMTLFSVMFMLIQELPMRAVPQQPQDFSAVRMLGVTLLTDHIFVFEVVGFLLLVALVGAATIARKKEKEAGE